jgi:hypothetical protein
MVIVPNREGPLVAAAAKVTVPDPLPLAPDAIAIHVALLAAVQGQPAPLVTAIAPVPPVAGIACACGDTAYEHP